MVRRDGSMEIHLRPILMKTPYARGGISHKGQREIEGQMSLRGYKFHQHEMIQEITPIKGKMSEPRYLRVKGDQSLIPTIILRSEGNRKKFKKETQTMFPIISLNT